MTHYKHYRAGAEAAKAKHPHDPGARWGMDRDEWFRGYADFSKAEIIHELLVRDRLPAGHVVIEQADMHDGSGRVSQTVVIAGAAEEYERVVHADEAYGAADDEC